jgi:hypothetical protein
MMEVKKGERLRGRPAELVGAVIVLATVSEGAPLLFGREMSEQAGHSAALAVNRLRVGERLIGQEHAVM